MNFWVSPEITKDEKVENTTKLVPVSQNIEPPVFFLGGGGMEGCVLHWYPVDQCNIMAVIAYYFLFKQEKFSHVEQTQLNFSLLKYC